VRSRGRRTRHGGVSDAFSGDREAVMWSHDSGEGDGFFCGMTSSKESGKEGTRSGEACGRVWRNRGSLL
jgi:hypothetical protein